MLYSGPFLAGLIFRILLELAVAADLESAYRAPSPLGQGKCLQPQWLFAKADALFESVDYEGICGRFGLFRRTDFLYIWPLGLVYSRG